MPADVQTVRLKIASTAALPRCRTSDMKINRRFIEMPCIDATIVHVGARESVSVIALHYGLVRT
jgi:hypothetical protein